MMISDVDYDHVYVHIINMDTCVHEMVRHTPTDDYVIFINAKISVDAQREAFEHAIDHIRNNDFEKESVQEIESIAHGLIPREEPKPVAVYKGSEEVAKYIKKLKAEQKKIHRKFERRWRRNNIREEMGFDFFAQEQNRLDNLTE